MVSTKITLNLEWGLFKEQINKILKFSAPLRVCYICPISYYFLMHIGWHEVSLLQFMKSRTFKIRLYLLFHFLILHCSFHYSNVSQEKHYCLKLTGCLIFLISLIKLTRKIHMKIRTDPGPGQTLPSYLTWVLMISFPAGRGCILGILSHSCFNHRSTTDQQSGLN